MDWATLLPVELWDSIFREYVLDEHDALRLAQTCRTLWGVYKGGGAKEHAFWRLWTYEAVEEDRCTIYGEAMQTTGRRRRSDGKKEGTWIRAVRAINHLFVCECEEQWANGKKHGRSRAWHRSGIIAVEKTYVQAVKHGRERVWFPDGTLYWETHYARGMRHGTDRSYYPTGEPRRLDHVVDGKLDGVSVGFRAKGGLTQWQRWRRGIPCGPCKFWDPW